MCLLVCERCVILHTTIHLGMKFRNYSEYRGEKNLKLYSNL